MGRHQEQLARMYAYSKNKLKKQNIDLEELERKANEMEKSISTNAIEGTETDCE